MVTVAWTHAVLDPNVATHDPSLLLQTLMKRGEAGLPFRVVGVLRAEHADAPSALALLRMRCKRPRDGCAAENSTASCAMPVGMAASRNTATRFRPGAICLSSSSHLPLMPYSN